MKRPQLDLSLIVAMTRDGVIGRDNDLPWRIPSDLQRFKKLTTGHPVIMGRKNWESIPLQFRPLVDRTNILITRQAGYTAPGAIVTNSIEEAYAAAARAVGSTEIFVIGGEEIYRQFLPFVQKAYITKIHASVVGDTHFPHMSMYGWLHQEILHSPQHPKDGYPTSFHIYERLGTCLAVYSKRRRKAPFFFL